MTKMGKFLLPALCGIAILGVVIYRTLPSGQIEPPLQQTESHVEEEPPAQEPTPQVSIHRSHEDSGASGMGNMFGPPPAPTVPPVTKHDPPPPPPVRQDPPPPEDPFRNYVYTGYATLEGRPYALLEDSRTHDGTWLKEGDSFQGYTVEHIARDSLRLHQGATERTLAMSDRFNIVPLIGDAPKEVLPDPGNLAAFRGKVGMSYYFQVTGRLNGSLWGSDPYTDDSNLGVAAVHAGILRDGQQGVVRVTILPGYDSYDGSTRNGVTSQSYAVWQGSFRVSR